MTKYDRGSSQRWECQKHPGIFCGHINPLRSEEKQNLLWRGTWLTALDNTVVTTRLAPFACILVLRKITFHLQKREEGGRNRCNVCVGFIFRVPKKQLTIEKKNGNKNEDQHLCLPRDVFTYLEFFAVSACTGTTPRTQKTEARPKVEGLCETHVPAYGMDRRQFDTDNNVTLMDSDRGKGGQGKTKQNTYVVSGHQRGGGKH